VRHRIKKSSGARLLVSLPAVLGEHSDLLSTLFQSSTVGVAICDRQLRYRAINDAMASMNGLPAAAHIGKTIHAVLGKAAAKVVPAFERVFATGRVVSNFELTAKLPLRNELSHWNESYFPIKDSFGQVLQVGAIVLEIAKGVELARFLGRLTENLNRVSASLQEHRAALELSDAGKSQREVLTSSQTMLNTCLTETRAEVERLQDAPNRQRVRPSDVEGVANAGLSSAGQVQGPQPPGPPDCADPLSPREREVAVLLAEGKTNKQIAGMLAISTRTVESHRAKIMLKLDLDSLSDLVRYALRCNLVGL